MSGEHQVRPSYPAAALHGDQDLDLRLPVAAPLQRRSRLRRELHLLAIRQRLLLGLGRHLQRQRRQQRQRRGRRYGPIQGRDGRVVRLPHLTQPAGDQSARCYVHDDLLLPRLLPGQGDQVRDRFRLPSDLDLRFGGHGSRDFLERDHHHVRRARARRGCGLGACVRDGHRRKPGRGWRFGLYEPPGGAASLHRAAGFGDGLSAAIRLWGERRYVVDQGRDTHDGHSGRRDDCHGRWHLRRPHGNDRERARWRWGKHEQWRLHGLQAASFADQRGRGLARHGGRVGLEQRRVLRRGRGGTRERLGAGTGLAGAGLWVGARASQGRTTSLQIRELTPSVTPLTSVSPPTLT